MVRKLVDGSESMLAAALAYLARKGLPGSEIRNVEILGEVGTPLRLRVELFVEEEGAAEITAPGDTERRYLMRDGSIRAEPFPGQETGTGWPQ